MIGLRRRVLSDLYHRLVTGGWLQLCLVVRPGLLRHRRVARGGALGAGRRRARAARLAHGGGGGALSRSARPRRPWRRSIRVRWPPRALTAVDGFVRWTELVIGAGIVMAKFSTRRPRCSSASGGGRAPRPAGHALLFRMANQRRGHVVDARVSLLLVRNEREPDGEVVRRAARPAAAPRRHGALRARLDGGPRDRPRQPALGRDRRVPGRRRRRAARHLQRLRRAAPELAPRAPRVPGAARALGGALRLHRHGAPGRPPRPRLPPLPRGGPGRGHRRRGRSPPPRAGARPREPASPAGISL